MQAKRNGANQEGIYLKMIEGTHQQAFGNISKPYNIQEEYTMVLRKLHLLMTKDYEYRLHLLREE